jgi:nucleotide-binding universal stress UspA family protein
MFRRIMVPLDGSSLAERALPVAARLARASGGTLVFVEVVNQTLTYSPYPMGAFDVPPVDLYDAEKGAWAYLKEVTARAELAGIAHETYVVSGPVAVSIIQAVADHHGDLLVLSSHGRAAVARWVLGSVAQKLARHAPVPVLVLRSDTPSLTRTQAGEQYLPFEVLVPLDGSPLAEAALQPADELLTALSGSSPATLRLLRVVELPPVPGNDDKPQLREELDANASEAMLREAQTYLSHVADRMRALPNFGRHVTIATTTLLDDDTTQGILDGAHGRQFGRPPQETPAVAAIVMATHGRGGLDRWAMGSVTERVLHESRFPLLIVPPGRASASDPAHASGASDDPVSAPTVS